jgi:hypothetical protein
MQAMVEPLVASLPPVEVPAAEVPPPPAEAPLIDSRWPFVAATDRLIDDKGYYDPGEPPDPEVPLRP